MGESSESTRVFQEVLRARGHSSETEGGVRSALANITQRELDDLRSLVKPNEIVLRTLQAMCLILDSPKQPTPSKPPAWSRVLRIMRDKEFVTRMLSFDIESLRSAPVLIRLLIEGFFGAGESTLKGGFEALTYQRVRRASVSVAALFHWCSSGMVAAGALPAAPEQEAMLGPSIQDLAEEQDEQEHQKQLIEREEALLLDQKNSQPPELTGSLAFLPEREYVVDRHMVLFLAMTNCNTEAVELATTLDNRGPCSKCDGAHRSDECPHFPSDRENHADAWERFGLRSDGEEGFLAIPRARGQVFTQPGDGSCLFHSLSFGLRHLDGSDAPLGSDLRQEIAFYLELHADETVAGSAFRDYIWWDHGVTVQEYVKLMAETNLWGGAIEMAAFARMMDVSVRVYSQGKDDMFQQVATFGDDTSSQSVAVVYIGRCHYDAFVVEETL